MEGARVGLVKGRGGVTGKSETIEVSVCGVLQHFAAKIALLRAALLALSMAALSGAVFGRSGTGRRGQSGSSAG
jgi:hypothetical protein